MMKSIENEKLKLKFIQTKQEELNKLIHNQNLNNNTTELNLNKTQKQCQIYNIDEKKTKKNMSLINNSKNVIDVVKKPIIITKTKVKDTSQEEQNTIKKEEQNTIKKEEQNTIKKEEQNTKIIKSNKKLNKNNENEPYKYYYKKDIKKQNLNVCWGTQEELYNTDKYTEPLTILLKIQPLFNINSINKINNDNKTLDDKIKILKNIYNFKKINKLKDTIINLIYKIMVYDNIFTESNF